jgi:hypothetical protein
VADRQHPHPRGQLGRHVQDLFAVADQPLRQGSADAVGPLDGPAALRPAACPLAQLLVAVQGGRNALAVEQPAVLIQHSRGVGGLVRVDTDHHRHTGAFLEGGQKQSGGQDRTTVLEPTRRQQRR